MAKSLKIFFSETRKPRALIFNMYHLLVGLYQECSYDIRGVKTGPAPGVTSFKHSNKEGKLLKIFYSETRRYRALTFGM